MTDLVEGEYQDIFKLFSKLLNFRIQQFKRVDGGWGTLDKESGQWNGLISNLINGEADVGIAALTLCCRRPEVVDFLWTLTHAQESFAIKGC